MNDLSLSRINEFVRLRDDFSIKIYDCIDSTNTEAKRLAECGVGNMVIIADKQTAGRGRLGRVFYSPKSKGLYISFLFKYNLSTANIVSVTTATAVAVKRAVKKTTDKDVLIKWVNDLYYGEKKVCGILAETIWNTTSTKPEYIIVGIGINCFDGDFPDELKDIAGTIGDVDRSLLAANLISEMYNLEDMILSKNYIEEYKKSSMVIGKEVVVLNTGEVTEAIDVDEFGGLVIRTKDGKQKTLSTGEISIRLYN